MILCPTFLDCDNDVKNPVVNPVERYLLWSFCDDIALYLKTIFPRCRVLQIEIHCQFYHVHISVELVVYRFLCYPLTPLNSIKLLTHFC